MLREEAKQSKHYLAEKKLLDNPKVASYYAKVISDVDLDRSNPKNSYIMFIEGKVDTVDLTKPAQITEGKSSLPDIDIDFPPNFREDVITYLKEKYGADRVCQMVTFGRLQGRSILKEVLRVNDFCSVDQMNIITSKIPKEDKISDLLEQMDEPSVLRWTLENDAQALSDYCWLENGELKGDYARIFEQALRLEGTFKSQGKHAAGVVITSDKLEETCPMVKATKSSSKVAGMEMNDLEAIGCVKFDILGVSALGKVANVISECEGI